MVWPSGGTPKAPLAPTEGASVTEQDLLKLMEWRQSEPDAPDGLWYKDFGSFKVCGEGQYPKTFLLKGQPAKGEPL